MGLALDEPHDDDHRYETEGITWLVSPKDHEYVMGGRGIQVDHVSGWFGTGFSVSRRGGYVGGCC